MPQSFVKLDDVLSGFDLLKARSSDLRPVFRQMRRFVMADERQHFDNHEGPDGPWAPRARSSITKILAGRGKKSGIVSRGKRKGQIKRHHQRRLDSQLGRLRGATEISITQSALVDRSLPKWAGVHQFGGTVGHGAVLPARPFMYASDAVMDLYRNRLLEHIGGAW